MARKQTLDAIIQLYKKLGGNTSEVLGTKTNINFLGKGKTPEPILEMDINAEALGVMPQSKAIEELTNSVGYALSGKLNDIQANKLLDNMSKMDNFYNPPPGPANIIDLGTQTGVERNITRDLDAEGLMSLRNKVKPIDEVQEFTKSKEDVVQDLVDRKFGKGYFDTVDDVSAPTGAGLEAIKSVKNNSLIVDDLVNKVYQMSGVAENAKPVARANARDFLNRIKDMEDPDFPGGTTLSSVMEADDLRFATEGGGGGFGDPLLLVQKYFGPKVASAVAKLDSPNDIQEFAENLVKIKDARGNSVTSRFFDPESINPDDFEFADGGLARPGYRSGKSVKGIMDVVKNFFNKKSNVVLNETLTQNETKYLKELIEDTGGGQFTSDIMEEVPSLKIIGNKISVDKQDINSLSKFLDDMYISDLAPSGRGVDKMPPRLRDTTNNILTKLLRSEKADGGRVPMFAGGAARIGYQALRKYGIEAKDISRLFASLGTDKSLVGKEKTEYFRNLHKVLKNPDDYPDGIREIQIQLGIDIPGLKSGGLAGILEV